MRTALFTALTTGSFCGLFALGVDAVTMGLSWWQIILAGAVSGFCGSMFAHLVLRGRS